MARRSRSLTKSQRISAGEAFLRNFLLKTLYGKHESSYMLICRWMKGALNAPDKSGRIRLSLTQPPLIFQ
jgi:hypothetical protein